eukprot:comp23648_c0_seq1/m.40370 comp23648_c0_seq1/g.40370  ORF comp23648_c0_seq1/g.40370 comp23648_c0_seq1/m.40370 type:complete len:305 (-) comp23648_c0_seq1:179-1093(-)
MAGGELAGLVGFSLAMLGGSFLAGSLPLSMNLSEKSIQLCNILGAGLLVGTALAVIIPEGVHTLYTVAVLPVVEAAAEHQGDKDHDHDHDHTGGGGSPYHGYVGPVLVAGFVFQMLVDKVAFAHGHNHGAGSGDGLPAAGWRPTKLAAATLGLVIHSAADGIALGAASAASKSELEALVFLAIMLHKAPAAFGLTSFLLAEGLDNKRVRQHLLAFALAAPLMALVTYGTIRANAVSTEGAPQGDSPVTGLALLFSAGTFLYVATVHVLPEVTAASDQHSLSRSQLAVLVAGTALPVLLSMGHHH